MDKKVKVLCRACETENEPGEITCRRCGLSMQAQEQNCDINTISCPRCLYANNPGSFFCYQCGKYFAESDAIYKDAESADDADGNPSPHAARVLMPGGTCITLSGAPTFIERSDFDGTLPHEILMSISRQHLLVTYESGVYYLQDYGRDGKGSTNHTHLNGVDIYKKGKQPLKDGDIIELANQPELKLIFKLD